MKKLVFLSAALLFACCNAYTAFSQDQADKDKIGTVLNNWHKAAAKADFAAYFSAMADDAVFIGTDPTENWNKEAFKAYSRPYFDKGKAWSFTPVERHIYFSDDFQTAWFDELLDTQMKVCRGSGIMKKVKGKWKIAHYVLSMTIPNDAADEVIKLKSDFDNAVLAKLKE